VPSGWAHRIRRWSRFEGSAPTLISTSMRDAWAPIPITRTSRSRTAWVPLRCSLIPRRFGSVGIENRPFNCVYPVLIFEALLRALVRRPTGESMDRAAGFHLRNADHCNCAIAARSVTARTSRRPVKGRVLRPQTLGVLSERDARGPEEHESA
jgi:hypothetical protein